MRQTTFVLLGVMLLALAIVGCETKNNVTPRDGAVKGTVVDRGDQAIDGAQVTWTQDNSFTSTTDSYGNFYIDGVNFGEQNFLVTKSGFVPKTFTATIYANYVVPVGKVIIATAAFYIQDLTVKNVSATTAEITFKTTEFTNCVIEFGESQTFGRSVTEDSGSYATLHTMTLPDLKAETRYYFRVTATRQLQTTEVSDTKDFTTLSTLYDQLPPSAPKTLEVGMTGRPNQLTVSWSPNSESDLKGYKIYRSELPLAGFEEITTGMVAKGREQYIDAGVSAGKKYYYRVTAVDQADNEGSSSDVVSMLVPGDIAQKVIWTRVHSPYVVIGDIDIYPTGVLEIEPGVEVRMADYDILLRGDARKIEFRIAGSLVASGTAGFPVTFSSSKPAPAAGDWAGLFFNRAQKDFSKLADVVIAHADYGIKVYQTAGTFSGAYIQDCTNGIIASQSEDLTIASCSIKNCDLGFLLTSNKNMTIASNTVLSCAQGMYSTQNDTITFSGNNILEYTDFGLSTEEYQGTITVENNLFVSPVGLGLHIVDKRVQVRYNTFDSGVGIRIDQNSPTIQKNVLIKEKSVLANDSMGIEYLATTDPLIEFGPNLVYGFPTGNDYVGCASSASSLATKPLFMKDAGGTSYDYRLRTGIPSNTDYWGIQRDASPL